MTVTATYPISFRVYVRNQNRIDVVEADDVNELQAELDAVQHTVGLQAGASALFSSATTVAERLAKLDAIFVSAAGDSAKVPPGNVVGLTQSLSDIVQSYGEADDDLRTYLTGITDSITSALAAEVTARGSYDTALLAGISNVAGNLATEITDRVTDVNQESTDRAAAITTVTGLANAALAGVQDAKVRLKRIRGQVERDSIINWTSSGSWRDFPFNHRVNATGTDHFNRSDYQEFAEQAFIIDASGNLLTYGLLGPWAISACVAFDDANDVGLRGIRLLTKGGSVLHEVIRPAQSGYALPDRLSLSWTGMLIDNDPSYYVTVQVFQNSGSTVQTFANAPSTPSTAWITRIPGLDDGYTQPSYGIL